MSFTDDQLTRFWDDAIGWSNTHMSDEFKRHRASVVLENLISRGYRIEFPELRYRVRHETVGGNNIYYIIDTHSDIDEVAGCFTDKYFTNAKELAEQFAEELNER